MNTVDFFWFCHSQ